MIVYPTENYDSWISVEDADSYFEKRLNIDEWSFDQTTSAEPILQSGFATLSELDLNIVFDDDDVIDSDYYTDAQAAKILKALQQAQCEQALHELRGDYSGPNALAVSLGGILSVKYDSGQELPRFSERAMALLRPYIKAKTVTRYR